jgi:PAS domain S-box-containing protein
MMENRFYDRLYKRFLHWLMPVTAALSIALGITVLIGWAFDIVVIKSILPAWVSMKANTAVCFILIGAGLLPPAAFPAARLCGLLAGLIGALTLSEYLLGWDAGIDDLLFKEPPGTVGTSHPGRMAPETALCFVFLAAALLMSSFSGRHRWITIGSTFLGLLVSSLAVASLFSYLIPQLGAFGWFGLTIMAPHAAILFTLLGAAITAHSWRQSTEPWLLSKTTTLGLILGMFFLVTSGLTISRTQHQLIDVKDAITVAEKTSFDQRQRSDQDRIDALKQEFETLYNASFTTVFIGTFASILAFILALLHMEGTEKKRTLANLRREQSETQIHALTDNLPGSYLYQFIITAAGTPAFRYVSSGVTRVHGVTPQAVIASADTLFNLCHADSLLLLQSATAESVANLSPVSLILQTRRADGRWGWIRLSSSPHRSPSGEIVWDGVATDITAQHENNLALRHISQRNETLLELPQKAETMDDRALMQYAMGQAEALTGSQIAFIHLVNDDQETIELVTWSSSTLAHYCTAVFDRHYPISQAGIWAEAARQKQVVVYNDYATADNKRGLPEGHSKLIRLISVPVIEGGKVRMMAGVGNKPGDYDTLDIDSVQLIANFIWRLVSKRKTDVALGIASRVVNASSVVCFRWRAEANWPVAFVSANVSQWGYDAESLFEGKPSFAEMVHPADLARVVQEVVAYTAAGRSTYVQEYRLLTGDGQIRWIIDETIVIRASDGSVEFYDGVLSDITDRKRAENTLNQALTDQRVLNKKLEQAHNQLLQSEKMASIGQLAAGVAHELNNPIGFVHSNLGTLEGYLHDLFFIVDAYDKAMREGAPGVDTRNALTQLEQMLQERDFDFVRDDIFQLINESRDGIDRVRRIVLDLKTFSRPGSSDWAYADINQGLESTLNIVWNELKYKCKVNRELGELPKVFCQMSQINQVFLNLLVNAGQAIEDKGEITLRTRREGEDQVVIEVTDTGKGIAPENLSRIFDPFFTTKAVGKGTGLGLSLSYSIVQAHHGLIEVESRVGKGTTFRVTLPIEKHEKAEKGV